MRDSIRAHRRSALAALAAVCVATLAGSASAVTLFSEDFNGYNHFPAFDPFLDPINPGLPLDSEGADERWYGIRFAAPSTGGSLDGDIAVQALGGGFNLTPVGRVEDEAGIVLNVSTLGYTSSRLDFDWKTFLSCCTDRLRVGYFVGDIAPFATSNYLDAVGTAYDWANWTPLFSGQNDLYFQHQNFSLPAGQASVWVAFWLDNGEGDYAKLDNVTVTAAPEPSALLLVGLAGAWLAARRLRAR